MALELGAGYVTLLPSARGFGAKVRSLTSREMKGAGTEAGDRFSNEMVSSADRRGKRFPTVIGRHTKKAADAAAKDGSKAGERFGDSFMTKVNTSLKVGAGVLAVGVGAMMKGAIDEASNAQQGDGAVEAVVGKDFSKKIKEEGRKAGSEFGITYADYVNKSATNIAFLQNKGMSVTDALKQNKEDMARAADLAAQYGGTAQEALDAILSARKGETDPIERYAISLNETAVNAKLAEMGVKKVNGQYAESDKLAARNAIIAEQSASAQGAAAREADTYAGAQMRAQAALKNLQRDIGDALLPALSHLSKVFATKIVPAISDFIQGMKDGTGAGGRFMDFLRTLQPFVGPVAAGIGAIAAAFVAYRVATSLATFFTKTFWKALAANPVGLVLAAIGALVAGLVWLYQNNETARRIMDAAWAGIKNAVSTAWTGYIKPALDRFVALMRDVVIPWVLRLWNNTIKPAFFAIGAWIAQTWTNTIRPALSALWGFIKNVLIPIIVWLWKNIVAPAFAAIGAIIKFAWNVVIKPVLTLLWGFIKHVLIPIILWLWKNVVAPAFKKIGEIIKVAWERVIKPALDALSGAIKKMPEYFDKAQDAIGKAWDKIKDAAKKPVKFVVEQVINPFINGANKLIEPILGKDARLKTIDLAFASGGNVPGHSPSATADNIPAWLTAGEFVTRYDSAQRMRKRHPGVLEYINAHGDLPGYARGGWAKPWPMAVGAAVRKMFGHRGAQGGYGARSGPSDHGTGNAIDFMVPDSSPLGDAIAAWGAANHEALRLKYIIWKKRIIGSGRWGDWRPYTRYGNSKNRTLQHYDHPHFSFKHGEWGNPAVLLKGLAPGVLEALKNGMDVVGSFNPLQGLMDTALSGLKSFTGSDSLFGKMASGTVKHLFKGLPEWAMAKLAGAGSTAVDNPSGKEAVGSGVQRWAPLVRQALGIVGEPTSLVDVVLRRMNQESGGNPRAVNNWDINARRGDPSKGLMQVIGGTFRQYAMPGYNSSIYDPLSNILASMRYAKSRYGSLSKAYNRRGGYADGGFVKPLLYDNGGILAPGLSLVSNQTQKPETIRTHEQEKALQASLVGGTGDTININGIKYDSVTEFADELNFALARRANARRYGRG